MFASLRGHCSNYLHSSNFLATVSYGAVFQMSGELSAQLPSAENVSTPSEPPLWLNGRRRTKGRAGYWIDREWTSGALSCSGYCKTFTTCVCIHSHTQSHTLTFQMNVIISLRPSQTVSSEPGVVTTSIQSLMYWQMLLAWPVSYAKLF